MKIKRLIIICFLLISNIYGTYLVSTDNSKQNAKDIAFLSTSSVYQLDNTELPNILKPYLKNKDYIKAIEIYENLENEMMMSFFRFEDKYYFNKAIPSHIKNYSVIVKEKIYFDKSEIGYVYLYINHNISLNNEEREYLEKKDFLSYCVDPNWMPYEKIEKGNYIGIGSDYLKLFEKKLDKEFKLVPTKSWTESKLKAKTRQCDILPLSSASKKRKSFMNVTKEYINEPLVLATKIDEPFIDNFGNIKEKTIAITKGYSIVNRIKERYPNIKVLETSGIIESLELVRQGKVYGCIDAISIINYYIKTLQTFDLKISSKLDMNYTLGMASNKTEPLLNDILNKAINSITDSERKTIFDKWNNKEIAIVNKTDYTLVYILFSTMIIIFIFFMYGQYVLRKANKNLQKIVDLKTKDLSDLNKLLEKKVKEQVEEIRNKELILMDQSKLASMGMMIGNIAHQWRQPLSIISSLSTGMMINKQFGKLNDEDIYKSLEKINDTTQHLSKTIETFRNFIKNDKTLEKVVLQDTINISLSIIKSSLENSQIKLIDDTNKCEKVEVTIVVGELSEVIINIINNAKDILIDREIKDPWIKINLEKKESSVLLNIEDNAGGIPEDILPRIFEPYFTTKHESQGTGLGLHMSYKIVTESLKSKIFATNSENGALFIIEIPLFKN